MHAPHHRHRMVLDSLGDEDGQHPETIDLSHLLSDQSNTTVVHANQVDGRPIHRRITEIVIIGDDDDTDGTSDSDTEDEPMVVEAATVADPIPATSRSTTAAAGEPSGFNAAARPGTSTAPANESAQDFKSPKRTATGSKSATEDDSDDEDSVSVKLGRYKKNFIQDISSNIHVYCNFR